MSKQKIIYTKTDEAPSLATRSFLPIIQAFTATSGIVFETKDISLSSRILAVLNDYLPKEQQVNDALAELGVLAKSVNANIIKLPNISASVPQLKSAIKELQNKGFTIPNYPEEIKTDEDKKVAALYSKAKGSAVNPVLREGNSDRRAPKAVKNYARKNPHSMGVWSADSKTHVATMSEGDFFHNEKSITFDKATNIRVEFVDAHGNKTILKENLPIIDGEIIDATVMSKRALLNFLESEISDAKDKGVLLSLHMKATMMKVSDPIIFGHAVKTFFKELFKKHQEIFDEIGVNVNNGFGNLLSKIQELPNNKRKEIENDIEVSFNKRADLAMVNSDKGITNLHVPSDVIIDASMPAMIRTSGQMWNKEGKQQDTKAIIPDSSYASIYTATIDFCKENGAFDSAQTQLIPK